MKTSQADLRGCRYQDQSKSIGKVLGLLITKPGVDVYGTVYFPDNSQYIYERYLTLSSMYVLNYNFTKLVVNVPYIYDKSHKLSSYTVLKWTVYCRLCKRTHFLKNTCTVTDSAWSSWGSRDSRCTVEIFPWKAWKIETLCPLSVNTRRKGKLKRSTSWSRGKSAK